MRAWLIPIVVGAFLVAGPRVAFADDGGDAGATDGGDDGGVIGDAGCGEAGADDAGVCCNDGGNCGAPDAAPDAPAAPIIACDGALCDSIQGRPYCAVSERSIGTGGFDLATVLGVGIAAGLCLVRRGRSGARRPGAGGGAC